MPTTTSVRFGQSSINKNSASVGVFSLVTGEVVGIEYKRSIHQWLREVISGARRVLDEDGVWTGARKWLVQLKPDPLAVGGGMSHPQLHHAGETPGRGVLSRHAQAVQELR